MPYQSQRPRMRTTELGVSDWVVRASVFMKVPYSLRSCSAGPMPNQFLTHPVTGGVSFGNVDEMRMVHTIIPAGEIRLSTGKHIGPNHGWGASHIWAEHASEMKARGLQTYEEVPAYVAMIIKQGTPLFFEGGQMRQIKLMGVRARTGTAILQFIDRREGPIWSVVTAFSGVRTHGTRVGAVR
jgi:hypothetical protein